MKALIKFTGVAAPLEGDNIDTDRIIPARLMRNPRDKDNDYSRWLFHDLRFNDNGDEISDFVLNQALWRNTSIIVSGDNFGCGSSRESAVYALADFGVRVVVASSFGDIFYSNCVRNGLAPLIMNPTDVAAVRAWLQSASQPELSVDLEEYTIKSADDQHQWSFEIPEFQRKCLMRGQDEVELTLQRRDTIDAFERSYLEQHPWLEKNA